MLNLRRGVGAHIRCTRGADRASTSDEPGATLSGASAAGGVASASTTIDARAEAAAREGAVEVMETADSRAGSALASAPDRGSRTAASTPNTIKFATTTKITAIAAEPGDGARWP